MRKQLSESFCDSEIISSPGGLTMGVTVWRALQKAAENSEPWTRRSKQYDGPPWEQSWLDTCVWASNSTVLTRAGQIAETMQTTNTSPWASSLQRSLPGEAWRGRVGSRCLP